MLTGTRSLFIPVLLLACLRYTTARSCSDPGASIRLRQCHPNSFARLFFENKGRAEVDLYFVDPRGKQLLATTIPPGQKSRLRRKTCIGQVWVAKSACGQCMSVHYVAFPGNMDVLLDDSAIVLSCPRIAGAWGHPIQWPGGLVPAGIANVPHPAGNKVLGFAAASATTYNSKKGHHYSLTKAALWDPVTHEFQEADLHGHDLFCSALTLLPDGRLFAGGGGKLENSYKVSTFDPVDLKWSRHSDTTLGHWYGTAVVAENDRVFIALGTDSVTKQWQTINNFPEISGPHLDFTVWNNVSGINMEGKSQDRTHWYPQMHLMPNGEILKSGTMNSMYRIGLQGQGTIEYVGKRNKSREEIESWGTSTIYFDIGKILTLGGVEGWWGDYTANASVYQRATVIDFQDPANIKTYSVAPLNRKRSFQNAVVLPSGEVLVIGGKDNTNQWNDSNSVLEAEIWNPQANQWTLLSAHQRPRNYHSVAILLEDGRVLSGGGGLCGRCRKVAAKNEPSHEIFSPPYLFDSGGKLRNRPVIVSAPKHITRDQKFEVQVSGELARKIIRFSLVKHSTVTHSLSTDQRQIPLELKSKSGLGDGIFQYTLISNPNLNIMTPGYWFLFAINIEGTPSVAVNVLVTRPPKELSTESPVNEVSPPPSHLPKPPSSPVTQSNLEPLSTSDTSSPSSQALHTTVSTVPTMTDSPPQSRSTDEFLSSLPSHSDLPSPSSSQTLLSSTNDDFESLSSPSSKPLLPSLPSPVLVDNGLNSSFAVETPEYSNLLIQSSDSVSPSPSIIPVLLSHSTST